MYFHQFPLGIPKIKILIEIPTPTDNFFCILRASFLRPRSTAATYFLQRQQRSSYTNRMRKSFHFDFLGPFSDLGRIVLKL